MINARTVAERLGLGQEVLARLIRLEAASWPADDEIVQFVFGRPRPASLASLPQQTTLERAIVHHLRAGRHWCGQVGWTYL